jgi:hypothetical protein
MRRWEADALFKGLPAGQGFVRIYAYASGSSGNVLWCPRSSGLALRLSAFGFRRDVLSNQNRVMMAFPLLTSLLYLLRISFLSNQASELALSPANPCPLSNPPTSPEVAEETSP